jgi:hypothetical protein
MVKLWIGDGKEKLVGGWNLYLTIQGVYAVHTQYSDYSVPFLLPDEVSPYNLHLICIQYTGDASPSRWK